MIRTVISIALPVDERLLIQKNVISHGTGKKRICIVTGTHGDELEGQYVCFQLNQIVQENLDKLMVRLKYIRHLTRWGLIPLLVAFPISILI